MISHNQEITAIQLKRIAFVTPAFAESLPTIVKLDLEHIDKELLKKALESFKDEMEKLHNIHSEISDLNNNIALIGIIKGPPEEIVSLCVFQKPRPHSTESFFLAKSGEPPPKKYREVKHFFIKNEYRKQKNARNIITESIKRELYTSDYDYHIAIATNASIALFKSYNTSITYDQKLKEMSISDSEGLTFFGPSWESIKKQLIEKAESQLVILHTPSKTEPPQVLSLQKASKL